MLSDVDRGIKIFREISGLVSCFLINNSMRQSNNSKIELYIINCDLGKRADWQGKFDNI